MERTPGHPSDLTDAQWEIIEPMLPLPKWLGREEKQSRRAIVDAILYVVRTGCSWRQLPVDFPPWQTVYWHFQRFNDRGVTDRIRDELREQVRIPYGRAPEPSAGVIDAQSVRGADSVGAGSRGYDTGERVNGRKRFIVTDTLGLLVTVWVLAASWQDRDGAKGAPAGRGRGHPDPARVRHEGFAGRVVGWAATILNTTLQSCVNPRTRKTSPFTPAAG